MEPGQSSYARLSKKKINKRVPAGQKCKTIPKVYLTYAVMEAKQDEMKQTVVMTICPATSVSTYPSDTIICRHVE